MNIYICYDSNYKEVTSNDFPGLHKILESKILEFDKDNPKSDLTNVREISKKFEGEKLILTEMFLSPLHYATAIHEIDAGDNPVLWYRNLNCFIQLRREFTLMN